MTKIATTGHWVIVAILAVLAGLFGGKMGGWVGKIAWPVIALLAVLASWREWK